MRMKDRPGELNEVQCPHCNGRACDDCDRTGSFPIEDRVECKGCQGTGCDDCADKGTVGIPVDPWTFCKNIWQLLAIADMWRKGCMPFPGCLMDQPAGLVNAIRFIWDDEDHVKVDRIGPMALML